MKKIWNRYPLTVILLIRVKFSLWPHFRDLLTFSDLNTKVIYNTMIVMLTGYQSTHFEWWTTALRWLLQKSTLIFLICGIASYNNMESNLGYISCTRKPTQPIDYIGFCADNDIHVILTSFLIWNSLQNVHTYMHIQIYCLSGSIKARLDKLKQFTANFA